MNETVDVVILSACNADNTAHIECRSQTFLPESLIDWLSLEGQYTNGDTAYLPMSDGEEATVGGKHLNDVALF